MSAPIPYEIESIDEIPLGSRVCIYGSGAKGRDLLARIKQSRPDVRVDCFLDSYASRASRHGLEQVSLDAYVGSNARHDLILVASAYANEIISLLEANGLHHFSIYSPKHEESLAKFRNAIRMTSLLSDTSVDFVEHEQDLPRSKRVLMANVEPVGENVGQGAGRDMNDAIRENNLVVREIGFSSCDEEAVKAAVKAIKSDPVDLVALNVSYGDVGEAATFLEAYLNVSGLPPVSVVRKAVNNSWRGIKIPESDVAYVYIPKCGSSSFLHALRCVYEEGYGESGQRPHETTSRNTLLRRYAFGDGEISVGKYFTVMRNPLHRTASLYHSYKQRDAYPFMRHLEEYLGRKPIAFEEFVDFVSRCPDSIAEEHFKSQSSYITNVDGEVFVTHVFDLDTMDSRIKEINLLLPRPIQLLHRNKSSQKTVDYLDMYYKDDHVRQVVLERYANDASLLERL